MKKSRGDPKEKYTLIDTWVFEAKNGSQTAMEMLVATFKPLILSTVQRYIYDTDRYEEALQDGALVVLEAVRAYDPELGVVFPFYLKNRLFQYFVNVSKAVKKQQENECAVVGGGEDDDDGEDNNKNSREDLGTVESPEQEILREIDRQTRHQKLIQMIGRLPEERASVIRLFYLEGRSLKEIAELQGVQYSTVRTRLYRGIKQLQSDKNQLI